MALPKIQTPIFETKLLSNGKVIEYRQFLVKEQKILLMASESKDEKDTIKAVKQVLNNCIITPDIDIDNLPIFDIEYLFLQLRARSVGETAKLKYKCNNLIGDDKQVCGNVVKIFVNLLEIEPTFDPSHSNDIKLSEKLGVVMKYPTFTMVEKLNIKTEVDMLNVISVLIDYIYDEDQIYYAKDSTKEELEDFVDGMSQDDIEKIRKFFNTMPRIKKDVEFKCKSCGYAETMHLEGIQSFLV